MEETIPLFTYIYSDPFVHYDPHKNEEQEVECLEIEKEKRGITSAVTAVGPKLRWMAKVATEQHFVTSYCNSYVLHFTGHGIDGSMAFESETGELKFINVSALRDMCRNLSKKPVLLFLSMCHGMAVGLAFAELGVSHIVTVRNDRILDKASLLFADQFYRALFSGNSVRDSFEQGLARLQDSCPDEREKFFLTGRSNDHSESLFPVPPSASGGYRFTDETPSLPPSKCNEVTEFFLGRRMEMHQTYEALVNRNRLVSVIGPKGIGKSQLALACCAYCRERYVFDAFLFWELDEDSVMREREYLDQMVRVFELPASPARPTSLDDICELIRTKWNEPNVLLVIDGINAGHEISSLFFNKIIDVLLKRVAKISVLTTSRQELRTTRPMRLLRLGPLKNIHAAELFVKRSPRNMRASELSLLESDLGSMDPLTSFSNSEIIKSLKGNPLVIERVASETKDCDLQLRNTELTMLVIPRILNEVLSPRDTSFSELPTPLTGINRSSSVNTASPPLTKGLTRCTSEFSHANALLGLVKSASESPHRGRMLPVPPLNRSFTHVDSPKHITIAEAEACIRDTAGSILGHERPLSNEDMIFLLKKLNCTGHLISSDEFNSFLEWFTKVLVCLAHSQLWLVPGCIYGFVNRTQASELLRRIPDTTMKKGMFIIGVSENDPCLVVSVVCDDFSVRPCKIYFESDACDAPYSTLARNPLTGANETIHFDKLSSAVIHLQQLKCFYPGVDKFEKLSMQEC